jgi:hypothetical protein
MYVATFHESSTELSRATAPEKKGSRHNPQHASWPICGSIPSFSSEPTLKQWGQSQASIDDKLLGLLDPYHQRAIDMFNTCSRVLTPRSLTDTDGVYHIETSESLQHSPRPSLLSVTLIPLNDPARSPFFQKLPNDLERNETINLASGSIHSTSTVIYYLSIAWANDIPPRDRVNKSDPEGSS